MKTGLMNLANAMPKADAGQKLTPEQNKAIFENISDLFDSMEMGQVEARDIAVSRAKPTRTCSRHRLAVSPWMALAAASSVAIPMKTSM